MKVDVPDNGPNIESLEAKPHGVLPLLDEQCRLGERATDTAFSENVNKLNGGCVAAAAALDQRGKTRFDGAKVFIVKHFVQPVRRDPSRTWRRTRTPPHTQRTPPAPLPTGTRTPPTSQRSRTRGSTWETSR